MLFASIEYLNMQYQQKLAELIEYIIHNPGSNINRLVGLIHILGGSVTHKSNLKAFLFKLVFLSFVECFYVLDTFSRHKLMRKL